MVPTECPECARVQADYDSAFAAYWAHRRTHDTPAATVSFVATDVRGHAANGSNDPSTWPGYRTTQGDEQEEPKDHGR